MNNMSKFHTLTKLTILILLIFVINSCFDSNNKESEINNIQRDNKENAVTDIPDKIVAIEAFSFQFSPNTISVQKGTTLKIIAKSIDVKHGIGISEYNIWIDLPVNQEKTFEFTANKAGKFIYYCTVPCGIGHENMKGTLTVL